MELDVRALPLGDFTFGPDDPWPGEAGLVVGYAIRHAGGVFLFDTGFVLADANDPELGEFYGKYKVRPRSVLEALDAAGIDREEITAIANCHLHLDHSGQNELFPGVPIYVQPAEWAAAHEPDYTVPRVTPSSSRNRSASRSKKPPTQLTERPIAVAARLKFCAT